MKKYFLSTLLFLSLLGLTYFLVFQDCDFNLLISSIKSVNPLFLSLAVVMSISYVLLGSLFLKRILKYFDHQISLKNAIGYTFTEIYFSAITPSYVGGQPVEMYEMKKDNVPYEVSSVIVLFSSMLNRIALIFLATIFLIIFHSTLFSLNPLYNTVVLIGYLTTLLVIMLFISVIYSQRIAKFLLKVGKYLITKIKFIKNKDEKKEKLTKALTEYQKCALITRKNPRLMSECFVIMLGQRIVFLLISYLVYLAFGFREYSLLLVMAFQICVTLGSDLMPTPGGVLVNESLLLTVNKLLYGETLALSGMLMVRTLNFYILVIISGLWYLFFHFRKKRVKAQDNL